jgi:hypothetical protein
MTVFLAVLGVVLIAGGGVLSGLAKKPRLAAGDRVCLESIKAFLFVSGGVALGAAAALFLLGK